MTLVQQPQPFDAWDWIYEIKQDGFRALALVVSQLIQQAERWEIRNGG